MKFANHSSLASHVFFSKKKEENLNEFHRFGFLYIDSVCLFLPSSSSSSSESASWILCAIYVLFFCCHSVFILLLYIYIYVLYCLGSEARTLDPIFLLFLFLLLDMFGLFVIFYLFILFLFFVVCCIFFANGSFISSTFVPWMRTSIRRHIFFSVLRALYFCCLSVCFFSIEVSTDIVEQHIFYSINWSFIWRGHKFWK